MRFTMSKEQEFADAETDAMQEATRRVLKWAHDLASCDEVKPDQGMYLTMQYVAQSLAGLKSAVKNYDETVAYFKSRDIAPVCLDCNGVGNLDGHPCFRCDGQG